MTALNMIVWPHGIELFKLIGAAALCFIIMMLFAVIFHWIEQKDDDPDHDDLCEQSTMCWCRARRRLKEKKGAG
jgi:hypothetical protein